MIKYILCIVMLVVGTAALRPHNPKFPPKEKRDTPSPTKDEFKKVGCTWDFSQQREIIIQQSKCGAPRDVFVDLESQFFNLEVSPGSVWVKRCVGLCEFDAGGTCEPTATDTRQIPVRIYDATTNKEFCTYYPVEEHLSCECCALSQADCTTPKVFNPRECSCKCPVRKDRPKCPKKQEI